MEEKVIANQLREGMIVQIKDRLYEVLHYEHVKLGRSGAFVRLKFYDLEENVQIEQTVSPTEKFIRVRFTEKPATFLYKDKDLFYFIDEVTYEQYSIDKETLSTKASYLVEGTPVQLLFHGEKCIGVNLPVRIKLQVIDTEPGFKGDTVGNTTKPATLSSGLVVQVPLFIQVGDIVEIDTRTSKYVGRA